jgi:hypothetical protein
MNEIYNIIKKGINYTAGKIIGKEKRLQRNSSFDEEFQYYYMLIRVLRTK